MPITDAEWDAGTTDDATATPETGTVGEYESEKDLIVAFLSENVDSAFTRSEIVRGVDLGDDPRPETASELLTEIQDELVDVVGDLVASGLVVDDVDAALDELVAGGTVAEREVARDGESVTYYRLNTGDASE